MKKETWTVTEYYEHCGECGHCGWWSSSKYKCFKTNKKLKQLWDGFPKWCPLPDVETDQDLLKEKKVIK